MLLDFPLLVFPPVSFPVKAAVNTLTLQRVLSLQHPTPESTVIYSSCSCRAIWATATPEHSAVDHHFPPHCMHLVVLFHYMHVFSVPQTFRSKLSGVKFALICLASYVGATLGCLVPRANNPSGAPLSLEPTSPPPPPSGMQSRSAVTCNLDCHVPSNVWICY